ncbi:YqhA family protein [Raoultibacter phocaeensis]|uniref:YqhA family protein n=1 Tax=Raoultibacter phocaeensis TaxID=2479841 RepID=UPI001118958B|nr:YqhA family protein [Raoultibacter phocaeensis]
MPHETIPTADTNDSVSDSPRTYDEEVSFPEGLSQKDYAKKAARKTKRGDLIVGWSRFIAIGPVLGLLLGAIVLTVISLLTTGHVVIETIQGTLDTKGLLVEFVELADIFLLAVVLYVMALGLYSLFISDDLPLPHWLEFHTLNDLKEKLIAIVGVALAVYFFGRVVGGDTPTNVLLEGVGISAVIIALAYFMKNVLKKK